MESRTLSQNFSAAKVVCIMLVVSSHWFTGAGMWPFATIALFVFGFSSAFFTGRIYHTEVDVGAFWRKKIKRLGVRYWLILAVLAVLLVAQGRNIFHWHTLVHIAGLSGVLNLFGPSSSALGAGLWFFTVLLFFYAAYPLMARQLTAGYRTGAVLALVTVALLVLDRNVGVGFSLWTTILGFVLGTAVGVNRLQFKKTPLLAVAGTALAGLVLANGAFGLRSLNGTFLVLLALAGSLLLTVVDASRVKALLVVGHLEKILLEIYLIHGYLFVHPTGHSATDFAISVALIIAAATALNTAGDHLVRWIFETPSKAVVIEDEDETDLAASA
jgi:peptidoglycan/LPS O-acetylase OafA/YrhL